jgi:uncharacterized protein
MKATKQLLVMVLFLITNSTYAQEKTEINENQLPYIEVTGTAEKQVIPDEIFVGFYLQEKYVNKVKVSIEEQEVKLKDAIKSIGVDLRNLSISDLNADYIKVSWQKKDVLTRKNYTLKLADAILVGKFFQELDKLNITDAYISKVSHSKIDSLKKEVKINAIKAAKNKADYLLTAIGEKTGKSLIVREMDITNNNYNSNYSNTYIDGVKVIGSSNIPLSPKDNDIQFQKITVESTIYVKFSIE